MNAGKHDEQALGTNNSQRRGETGHYYQENDEYYQERNNEYKVASEFAAASQGSSPVLQPKNNNEDCVDEPAEEGSLFGDSSCGDEIARWMEDQRSLQQQQSANGQLQDRRGTTRDDSPTIPTEPSPEAPSKSNGGGNNDEADSGIPRKNPPKRSAGELTSSSSHKPSAKRRQRSQPAPPPAAPDVRRSASRIRMDDALRERHQSQMELRAALLSLGKAREVARGCGARYRAAKARVRATAAEECASLLEEETPWNEMFRRLERYASSHGDCNVKQNFGAGDGKSSPEMVRRLSAWVGKNRKDGKRRGRGAVVPSAGAKRAPEGRGSEESDFEKKAPPADATCGDVLRSEDHFDDSSVFDDVDPDSIHADPYKEIALDSISFDWNPRNSQWLRMYEELRRYKEEHGNTLVPHSQSGLGAWVKRQQVQYTLYISKCPGTKSDLTEERVCMLNDLGFIWSRRTNTWNENFIRLTKWKDTHGSCHIPDGSKDPELASLHKWVADQRCNYKRQIADEEGNNSDDPNATDRNDRDEKLSGSDGNNAAKKKSKRKPPKLSQEKISKLQSIGFEFNSRDANWLQKLEVLLKYKQSQGDFLVPSTYPEDPTLSNWVAAQRAGYKLYMKGKKSNLTERRLKILTDAGFPFSVNRQKVKKEAAHQDRVLFDSKPWLEKYRDFLLYIAAHGSLESIRKTDPFLAEWVAKEQEVHSSSDCANTDNGGLQKYQVGGELQDEKKLMDVAHFFVFSQSNKEKFLLFLDKNPG